MSQKGLFFLSFIMFSVKNDSVNCKWTRTKCINFLFQTKRTKCEHTPRKVDWTKSDARNQYADEEPCWKVWISILVTTGNAGLFSREAPAQDL